MNENYEQVMDVVNEVVDHGKKRIKKNKRARDMAIENNIIWVEYVQNWVNQQLSARGYLYLNEVCDKLGLPYHPVAHVVGLTKE